MRVPGKVIYGTTSTIALLFALAASALWWLAPRDRDVVRASQERSFVSEYLCQKASPSAAQTPEWRSQSRRWPSAFSRAIRLASQWRGRGAIGAPGAAIQTAADSIAFAAGGAHAHFPFLGHLFDQFDHVFAALRGKFRDWNAQAFSIGDGVEAEV